MPADPFDALTDLFLGEVSPNHARAPREPSPPARPAAARSAREPSNAGTGVAAPVERLILGHLPVMAGAWLSQYARATADVLGRPVALAHPQEGRRRVEIVEPSGAARRPIPHAGTFDEAIRVARTVCGVVLLAGEEAGLRPDRCTLLTSGDEAGIVASYQLLKSLGPAIAGVPVGACIAGMTGEPAQRAFRRLAEASDNFLGMPLEQRPSLARIESSRASVCLYDAQTADEPPAAIWPASAPASATEAATPPAPTPAPAPSVPPPFPLPYDEPRRAARTEPTPAPRNPGTAGTGGSGVIELCSLIDGLTPLPARCPSAQRVEFAKGPDGRLHLLARLSDDLAAVESLLAARAWARLNGALLALASPGLDPGEAPEMHLFVSDAPSGRRLAETELRVHAIAPAAAVVRSGWAVMPLN